VPLAASDLEAASKLANEQQIPLLNRLGQAVLDQGGADPLKDRLITLMVARVEDGSGTSRERLRLGEVLGWLGDPRLKTPEEAGYWSTVEHEDGVVDLARFPVTNTEFRAFAQAGGYEDASLWDADGLAWLKSSGARRWVDRAGGEGSAPFVVPNQPVVGVNWFEAKAYATKHQARLPRFDERLWATRGSQKRPYPWGSPFGEGNANTQEEVLGRPCAIGLFVRDATPEGIRDLAGNVAEWNEDGAGGDRWIHPGAWDQPSMAAWAKARFLEPKTSHWPALGFRIARD
jgi:formylglycine-generating enzyme required for sulfatase activity